MSPHTRLVTLGAVATALVAITALPSPRQGHAAGTAVSASRLSTFRPSNLPPQCTTQTLTASADTWVDEQNILTNYGTATGMNINGRKNQTGRSLVQFTLPSPPAGCTLTAAKLRGFSRSTTTGRTIDVYRASALWTETTVSWSTAPGITGTAVGVASASGWMEWSVTAHVQALYSGTNNGFVLRDSTEGGTTTATQQYDTREGTNKPELVLVWSS